MHVLHGRVLYGSCAEALLLSVPCADLAQRLQVFTGDYLGPSEPLLPIVATGRQAGAAGAAVVVRTAACTVTGAGHTTVMCFTPAGVGTEYTWSLSVAGQTSAPSSQTTSYGPPSVTAVIVAATGAAGGDEPGSVPTAGGAAVTLTGINFGADAARIAVFWNGVELAGVAVNAPHTSISFSSLPGQGAGSTVTLIVGGQPAANVVRIPFAAPRVTSLRLDTTVDSGASMNCDGVGADGRPNPAFGAQQRAVVVIRGVNFGRGDATVATVRNVPCILRAPVGETQIVCETPLCTGAVPCHCVCRLLHFWGGPDRVPPVRSSRVSLVAPAWCVFVGGVQAPFVLPWLASPRSWRLLTATTT
jgi:hypothetical protein